jgi:hypothetical protein
MKNTRLVKIKTWEQLQEEFGLDLDGDINCKYGFTREMEEIIPKNRIILLENGLWEIEYPRPSISDDMIEEELNPEDYPQYFI